MRLRGCRRATLSWDGTRGQRWIYVRDIVKFVIMLREPTSFLIAGNYCGTGLRDLTYELAEQAAKRARGKERERMPNGR